jgi:anti-sigma factor RsiW
MTKPTPLNDQERADLVAYLDGELTGEAARALEAKLSLHPEARAEAESLRRAWELLDYLPRPEPSSGFTGRTLSKLAPLRPPPPVAAPGRRWRWRGLLFGLAWAGALLLAALGGYAGFDRLVPREPTDEELLRDVRILENRRYYDLVDNVDFLRELDQPDLFGEEAPGR